MSVFVVAAEAGSLIAAARRFGLSASMAGKHVAALEAELNVRLMQRTTRRLSLTDAGQAYYARCKRILEEFDDANREARNIASRRTGYFWRDASGPGCRALFGPASGSLDRDQVE
jgi:DNA-binding transcriptional LysR family regulator